MNTLGIPDYVSQTNAVYLLCRAVKGPYLMILPILYGACTLALAVTGLLYKILLGGRVAATHTNMDGWDK